MNLSVEQFWKFINICRSYDQKSNIPLFSQTWCISYDTDECQKNANSCLSSIVTINNYLYKNVVDL